MSTQNCLHVVLCIIVTPNQQTLKLNSLCDTRSVLLLQNGEKTLKNCRILAQFSRINVIKV